MPADMVVPPYILLPRLTNSTGYGIDVEEEKLVGDASNDVVGHKFFNQFETMESVERIKTPIITVDRKGEELIRQQAEVIFNGIAPIKMQGTTVHLGIWDWITQWMGVENCYIELMDRPELMHAIMYRITNATIASIEPYMKKLFPYFGAIYYGCCDRLDDRMDIITQMPNIRKISCSPWSNREVFANKLPKGYVMSNKPTPALLAVDNMSYDEVRADIRRTMKAAKDNNVNLELILKDISTARYEPQRLWKWSKIALEEAENY